MKEDQRFAELLSLVRTGDAEAAEDLVAQYESQIRRVVRVRLRDSRLRRLLDSVDICQSVMGEFFLRVGMGQFELETPEQLISLLVSMARNKLTNMDRHQRAAKRDVRRTEHLGVEHGIAARDETPSQIVERAELADAIRDRLSADEREIVELRNRGQSWDEIASERGGTADSNRMQLTRALDRVSHELGFSAVSDD